LEPLRKTVLIFDLDGTIVNSSTDVLGSLDFALRSVGLIPTRCLDSRLIGPPLAAMIREAVKNASDADVEQAVAVFRQHYDSSEYLGTELYPGVRELLQTLGGMGAPCLIATNKPRLATVSILERLGVRGAFADILCIGDDEAMNKTTMVGELLERHRPTSDDGWLIGDAPSDIQAGKAHGLKTVAHLGGYSQPDLLLAQCPDFAIQHMNELLPLLCRKPRPVND
jgi:phosphoglycolate phosphatase